MKHLVEGNTGTGHCRAQAKDEQVLVINALIATDVPHCRPVMLATAAQHNTLSFSLGSYETNVATWQASYNGQRICFPAVPPLCGFNLMVWP